MQSDEVLKTKPEKITKIQKFRNELNYYIKKNNNSMSIYKYER